MTTFFFYALGHLLGSRMLQGILYRCLFFIGKKIDTKEIFMATEQWWNTKLKKHSRAVLFYGTPLMLAIWYAVSNFKLDLSYVSQNYDVFLFLQIIVLYYAGLGLGNIWKRKRKVIYFFVVSPTVILLIFLFWEDRTRKDYVVKTGAEYIRLHDMNLERSAVRLVNNYLKTQSKYLMVISTDYNKNSEFLSMVSTELALRKKRILLTTPLDFRNYLRRQNETGTSPAKKPWHPHEVELIIFDNFNNNQKLTERDVAEYKAASAFFQRKQIKIGWMHTDLGGTPEELRIQVLFAETYTPKPGEVLYIDLDKI